MFLVNIGLIGMFHGCFFGIFFSFHGIKDDLLHQFNSSLTYFIFRTLSPCGMRLPVNWVNKSRVRVHIDSINAQWDSTSAKSTVSLYEILKKVWICKSSLNFRLLYDDPVDVESDSASTQMWSLTPRWLSWRGVRLHGNRVTVKWSKVRTSRRIQEKNRNHSPS